MSSYQASVGLVEAPAWLDADCVLSQFGRTRSVAAERCCRFVEAGQPAPRERLRNQVFRGSGAFVERMQAHIHGLEGDLGEVPVGRRAIRMLTVSRISDNQYYRKSSVKLHEADQVRLMPPVSRLSRPMPALCSPAHYVIRAAHVSTNVAELKAPEVRPLTHAAVPCEALHGIRPGPLEPQGSASNRSVEASRLYLLRLPRAASASSLSV